MQVPGQVIVSFAAWVVSEVLIGRVLKDIQIVPPLTFAFLLQECKGNVVQLIINQTCLSMKNSLRFNALIKRLMRITLIQLALAVVVTGGAIAGGTAKEILNKPVTLEVSEVSLKNVLERIEKAVDVKFAYSKDAIDAFEKVSINVKNEKL